MTPRSINQLVAALESQECKTSLVTPLNSYRDSSDQYSFELLHVDDDKEFAEITATFLERAQNNFSVTTETTPQDGLDRLAREEFDCVVSDYQMPEMDGLSFLDAVRAEYPELPFILYTGQGSEEVASDAITRGVTDYMQKETGSDQFEVLANRVQNAIDQYWAAEELWTALTWYQRLVEQDLAGIYLVQAEEIIYVNDRFADIFGYTQRELMGMSAYSIVAESDLDVVRENLRRRESGEADNIRYSFTGKRKDNEQIKVEVHGGAIEFNDQPAVLGILLDVAE